MKDNPKSRGRYIISNELQLYGHSVPKDAPTGIK